MKRILNAMLLFSIVLGTVGIGVQAKEETMIHTPSDPPSATILDWEKDIWSFSNAPRNFVDGHYRNDKYEEAIDCVELTKKDDTWIGSCFGMSVVAALANEGLLNPECIAPYESISQMKIVDEPSRDTMSLINYYHFMQYKPGGIGTDYVKENYKNLIEAFQNSKYNCAILELSVGVNYNKDLGFLAAHWDWFISNFQHFRGAKNHSVMAYDLHEAEDGCYSFFVYDCNLQCARQKYEEAQQSELPIFEVHISKDYRDVTYIERTRMSWESGSLEEIVYSWETYLIDPVLVCLDTLEEIIDMEPNFTPSLAEANNGFRFEYPVDEEKVDGQASEDNVNNELSEVDTAPDLLNNGVPVELVPNYADIAGEYACFWVGAKMPGTRHDDQVSASWDQWIGWMNVNEEGILYSHLSRPVYFESRGTIDMKLFSGQLSTLTSLSNMRFISRMEEYYVNEEEKDESLYNNNPDKEELVDQVLQEYADMETDARYVFLMSGAEIPSDEELLEVLNYRVENRDGDTSQYQAVIDENYLYCEALHYINFRGYDWIVDGIVSDGYSIMIDLSTGNGFVRWP